MRLQLLAILLIVLPVLLMMPLENQIHAESQQLRYGGQPVTRELRDQIGQGLAIALLAGFRGIVADFIFVRATTYWDQRMWFKQSECFENAVKLQPQSTYFWDNGAWQMAWNIAYAERIGTNDTTRAQGISRERLWHERARSFMERGLQNIPNRYDLYFKLGTLYQQKLAPDCGGDEDCARKQYRKAAGYYEKAATFATAPSYVDRDAARCLEKSGDVRGAYDYWRKILDHGAQKREAYSRPIIQREIRRLEETLAIPDNERMFPQGFSRKADSIMKFAILSDVHSNLEALQVVLNDSRQEKCTHYVCLGDIVGYGPDPIACLKLIRDLNCPTVMGNHDEYCAGDMDLTGFNPMAADAIKWTRKQLDEEQRTWLRNLKFVRAVESFTIVHSTLDLPEKWAYVFTRLDAAASFNYQHTSVCFNGHTHVPLGFVRGPAGIQGGVYTRIKIEVGRKYFINVGSIGQPRDRNPKSSYVTYDLLENLIEIHRLDYDFKTTQKKIIAAGLPRSLAERLEEGK